MLPDTHQPDDGAGSALAGLLALAALVGTINGASRVAMPLFAAALGAPAWQVGFVGGLGYAGMLTLALPMGAWVDRHGSRVLFMRGVLVAAALYVLMALARQPWQAVLGAALLGLALPFRVIPAQTEFLALLPRLSAAKAGWNRGANTVGMFFFGPALAAALIAAAGFAPVFLLAAAGLLVALGVGARVLQGPHSTAGAQAGAQAVAPEQTLAQRIAAQARLVASHADLRRTMGVDFLTQIAVAYFVVFGIVLATRRFGMPLQAAAALVTMQGAVYVALLLLAGGPLMRWREDTRYLAAFVLLAVHGLVCAFGGGPWALWLGAALMGVGMALQSLSSTARFAALMQRYGRGRIGGLGSLGPPAGGVLGAMLGGLLSQRLGIEFGFGLLGVAYLLLLPAQWRRWKRSANDERDP